MPVNAVYSTTAACACFDATKRTSGTNTTLKKANNECEMFK